MTKVVELIKKQLEGNGFDGLVAPNEMCACRLDTLCGCKVWFGNCQPWYDANRRKKHFNDNKEAGV